MTKQTRQGRPRNIPVFYNMIEEDDSDSPAKSQDFLFVLANKDDREIGEMERRLIESIQSKKILLEKNGKVNDIHYKLLELRVYTEAYFSSVTKAKLTDLFGAVEPDKRLKIKKKGIDLTIDYIEGKLKRY
jgi:hypothetical protein